MTDEPRLIARRSELGYVERIDQALPDEPEAVSAAEQRQLTRRVRRAEERRISDAWSSARSTIAAALADFLDARPGPRIANDVRGVERSMRRISDQLGR